MTGPIVLFDGLCRFCDASVNFIIDHDPVGKVHFAALESAFGRATLARFGLAEGRTDSLVLVERGRCFTRSTAALRITRHLRGLWPLLGVLLFFPEAFRDFAYEVIAANRYRWFGTLDACRVPTPEVRQRFLE